MSYQIEYQNTNITLEDLQEKYSLCSTSMKVANTWVKPHDHNIDEPHDHNIDEPEAEHQIVVVTKQTPPLAVALAVALAVDNTSPEEMMKDIKTFKRSLLDNCIEFINTNSKYAEVKEIKDVAKIVMDLEDSFKDKTPKGATVNVLINNITEKFKDDC